MAHLIRHLLDMHERVSTVVGLNQCIWETSNEFSFFSSFSIFRTTKLQKKVRDKESYKALLDKKKSRSKKMSKVKQ